MRRPTFCSPGEQHSPCPAPGDKESRLSKMKRMITGSILMGRKKKESEGEKENNDGCADERMDMDGFAVCLRKESAYGQALKEVHIEVPASATTEIVLKPRKRKERLDSGGSLDQETKVIRSSSEERPEPKSDANVRRVVSHEELCALANVTNTSNVTVTVCSSQPDRSNHPVEPLRQSNPCPGEEQLEARRTSERFSRGRCAAPRRRKVSRRVQPPPERSPSPSTPKLDVSSLHQQMEGDEPITSRGKILSPDDEPESPTVEALISPRNSLVMRLTYLDPNLPPSPPQLHLAASISSEKQEKRLTKQINSIKRQIKRYEEGFRFEFGYKPSHTDKMANKDIKRLCGDIAKLKTQLNQLREKASESDSTNESSTEGKERSASPNAVKSNSKCNKTMEDALQDVEKRLQEKRSAASRSSEITEMTREQLLEEKLAVQKALLSLENTFGRPVDPSDRDLARPLYQRYRALKRLVIRASSGKLNSSTSELATILEHETMEFTASVSVDAEPDDLACSEPCGGGEFKLLTADSADDDPNKNDCADDMNASSSSSDSLAENLHALPLSQLLEQEKRVKEDKKRLRRRLREFENQFQSETGRRAQKQDRVVIESIYLGYKQAKAKLRLLEALIAKKSQVKRNSC